MDNISYCELKNKKLLREVMVKIRLKRIDTQKELTVEVLLGSGTMEFVMSLEFTRKQGFKLKKIERLIYMRNVNGTFNKEELIEHTVEVNIYYQGYTERIEIDIIERQKWNVTLGMLWLVCHNFEIN